MKRPTWLRLPWRKPAPNPRVVTVTLTIDMTAFQAAMKQAAAATRAASAAMRAPMFADAMARVVAELKGIEESMAKVKAAIGPRSDVLARMTEEIDRQREVVHAGLEAKWYVRGGMDPDYAHPRDRDQAVRDLSRYGAPDLAAALIRGWVTHHEETG